MTRLEYLDRDALVRARVEEILSEIRVSGDAQTDYQGRTQSAVAWLTDVLCDDMTPKQMAVFLRCEDPKALWEAFQSFAKPVVGIMVEAEDPDVEQREDERLRDAHTDYLIDMAREAA